jgi:hypothetical protein
MPLSIIWEQTSSRKQRTLHVIKPKRTVRIGSVRLPKWFLQRQYDLQLLYATSGWPFSVNVCGIVQYNSPFFRACQGGDIETIKVLLSSQQASIYDRCPLGTTAFHVALSHHQLEVCKLLRHVGIFARFDDIDYQRSLSHLQRSVNDFTEHNFSLLRVAAPFDNPDGDWFEEYCQTSTEDGSTMVYADSKLLHLLNSAQSDNATLNISHMKAYFELTNTCDYVHGSFMSYIVRVLSSISAIQEITAARDRHTWIVYALANEIAHEYLREKHLQDDTYQLNHSVRQALCAVITAGLNPHQVLGKFELPWLYEGWYQGLSTTPLALLCVEAFEAVRNRWESRHQTWSQWSQGVNAKLRAWIEGLHSAGIDLLQYAESESACYACSPDSLDIPWDTGGSIIVVTGPTPEDWRVSLWQPCDSYARLFWCWAEEAPIVPNLTSRILEALHLPASQTPTSPDLPGSWPSDKARIAEELESWLLQTTDDFLTEIEEDLSVLSESDLLAEWYRIEYIPGIRSQTSCLGRALEELKSCLYAGTS